MKDKFHLQEKRESFIQCLYCRMCICFHEMTFGAAGELWHRYLSRPNISYKDIFNLTFCLEHVHWLNTDYIIESVMLICIYGIFLIAH